jgi:hypothetical protein
MALKKQEVYDEGNIFNENFNSNYYLIAKKEMNRFVLSFLEAFL